MKNCTEYIDSLKRGEIIKKKKVKKITGTKPSSKNGAFILLLEVFDDYRKIIGELSDELEEYERLLNSLYANYDTNNQRSGDH